MAKLKEGPRRFTREFLEELSLSGLCESELWYLRTTSDLGRWYSHKLRQLAYIREHIDSPSCLLRELVQLNLSHPDEALAAAAQAKLQSWEEGFNPCTNPKGAIFEEEILKFGISLKEVEYLQTSDNWSWDIWLSYKLDQLKCIHTHIENGRHMMRALAQLNFDCGYHRWDGGNAMLRLTIWEAGGYPISKPDKRAAKRKTSQW